MSRSQHTDASASINTWKTKFFVRRPLGLASLASAAALLVATPTTAAVTMAPVASSVALVDTTTVARSWDQGLQVGRLGDAQLVESPAPTSHLAAIVLQQQGGVDISMRPVADASAQLQPAIYVRDADATFAPDPSAPASRDPDLFGSVALQVGGTPEDAKWTRARAFTPSAAAGPWAEVIQRARSLPPLERLAAVNAFVNRRIAYATPEAQYGVADYWATARESLTSGRGNCTAYAIAKLELLRAAGVPAEDLYLVLVKDLVRRADHAIVAVRQGGRFLILDSGADAVLSQADVSDYRPILTYGYGRTWIHGYRQAPRTVIAAAAEASPRPVAVALQ
jgi:predicted transglutaminase-like cysteine proteinase